MNRAETEEDKDLARVLSEKTLVPIGLIWTVVIAVVGAVAWISFLAADTRANSDDIRTLKDEMKNLSTQVTTSNLMMIEKLTRIETKLEERKK